MRIATANAYQNALEAMNQRQAKLVRTQEELASGKRVLSPSDDPSVASTAERNRAAQRRLEIQTRMHEYAMGNLSQAESVLGIVGDLLQMAREAMVQAGNGTYSATDRQQIAIQLRAHRDELLALANRGDGTGGYLFSGQGSSGAPFIETAGVVTFQPQAGEREIGMGTVGAAASLDGQRIFMNLPDGAGGVRSIFAVLDAAAASLEDPTTTGAAVGVAVRSGLTGIDAALEQVSTQRTEVGESLRALETRVRLAEEGRIELSAQLSGMVDVDYAKAVSDFQTHQTALSAAMRTYAQISQMSLFDYL